MSNLIWIIMAAIVKVLLCKLLALGMFLLVFFVKGKQLHFNSEQWDDYFLAMTSRKLDWLVMTNYAISATLSSFTSFLFLRRLKVPHAAIVALILLFVGGAISGYRYFTNQRAYIQKRYLEIPETILQRKEDKEVKG